MEIVYTVFMYHGFKSHALRHALDGELAMPCNLRFATAGFNPQSEGYIFVISLVRLRHALDGELAVPCNLQSAIAGFKSQWRALSEIKD